jgi:hypothetical protein
MDCAATLPEQSEVRWADDDISPTDIMVSLCVRSGHQATH